MKLFIFNNSIYTDNIKIKKISAYTEYEKNNKEISLKYLNNNNFINSEKIYNILLVPMTHINNIWHLMHHLFILFKYINKNKIDTKKYVYFPIFFENFYERQGDITKCIYNDLIFRGLRFDYNKFLDVYNIFKNNRYINSKNDFQYVNEKISFKNEELFNKFKSYILESFNIKRKIKDKKSISFILRKGTREITNINFVKEKLKNYNVKFIFLENYSIVDQLKIVSNSDILIGVHGAGLTWSIFMKNNSLLIEMYPGNSKTDNYERWCKIANISYYRLPINIVEGNEKDFRNTKVSINKDQINIIRSKIK